MKKKIAILAEDDYEDLELWYPYYRLIEAGHEVKVVGSGRKPIFASKHGPVRCHGHPGRLRSGQVEARIGGQ
jgi:putative intracellular protease/amidase